MAWTRHQNKAIWRDPVTVAQTLIIANYGMIEEYASEPVAPSSGARLFILTSELNAGKYIIWCKFRTGQKIKLKEWEADPIA